MWQPRQKISAGLLSKLKEKQEQLRNKIVLQPLKADIQYIAGCDSAFFDENKKIISVFVIFTYPDLHEIEVSHHTSHVSLPYIPGYLAFREIPTLLHAYKKLHHAPDVIMVDGHGIMHPRRMGIATHLGIILKKPTIGVAKSILTGTYTQPTSQKGSTTYVYDTGEILGCALRSKDNVKPIFVSPGQMCDVESARDITMVCLQKHKLPEPTRIADYYSKKLKPH